MMARKLQSLFVKKVNRSVNSSGMPTMLTMKSRWKPVIYVYNNLFDSLRRLKDAEKVRKSNC